MDKSLLETAVLEIKTAIHDCVTTKSYNGKPYDTGLQAKTALIRSSTVIQRIHEAAKRGLHKELERRSIKHEIHPALGKNVPELDVWGLLKKKRQDIVVLMEDPKAKAEIITEGPLKGEQDKLGREATKRAIVIGVRSQLSSIDKNYDTIVERALAETLNLRLRHPYLVMGEVFLVAVREYDAEAMKKNEIAWKQRTTNVERFISIFSGLSGRVDHEEIKEAYKYERSALLLVDFSLKTPKIYWTLDELRDDKFVSDAFSVDYSKLSPRHFSRDLLNSYLLRHPTQSGTNSITSQKLRPKS